MASIGWVEAQPLQIIPTKIKKGEDFENKLRDIINGLDLRHPEAEPKRYKIVNTKDSRLNKHIPKQLQVIEGSVAISESLPLVSTYLLACSVLILKNNKGNIYLAHVNDGYIFPDKPNLTDGWVFKKIEYLTASIKEFSKLDKNIEGYLWKGVQVYSNKQLLRDEKDYTYVGSDEIVAKAIEKADPSLLSNINVGTVQFASDVVGANPKGFFRIECDSPYYREPDEQYVTQTEFVGEGTLEYSFPPIEK